MRAIILHGEQTLLAFRLGELLMKEAIRNGRWLSYVEAKSGVPQAYMVVDEGGARWAKEALPKMETVHHSERSMLLEALNEMIEEMKDL